MHPLHPIHQAFISRPAFCKLADFFYLLDQMEAAERTIVLTPILQVAFQTAGVFRPPSHITTEEAAWAYFYERFKEWCAETARRTSFDFVVFSVTSYTLAWMCRAADEKIIPEVTAHNESDKRKARKAFAQGSITHDQLQEIEAKADANIAKLEKEVQASKLRYEHFCKTVVERIPRDSP